VQKKRIAYIDGSSVGMFGYLLNGMTVISRGKELTNNQAEWNALHLLLLHLRPHSSCKVYSDSMLVVNQFNDKWRIKDPSLLALYFACKELVKRKHLKIELVWIPREMNKFGKVLERELARMRRERWRKENSKN